MRCIKINNTVRRLVGKDYWTRMSIQPFNKPDLVIPCKTLFGIADKFNVIGWVSIDKIIWSQSHFFKTSDLKIPRREQRTVSSKIGCIVDRFVLAKRNIEFIFLIEAT